MRFGSLFSGIGGLDLGLEMAGLECAWQSEIDSYASRVLARHWPNVTNYGDIKILDPATLPAVDLLCGGFPCQPFSTAAAGRNILSKDRRGDFARVIFDVRPKYVLAENVSRAAIEEFAATLVRDGGWGADVFDKSAADVGADHQRDRWWCIAYPNDEGQFRSALYAEMAVLPQVRNRVWGWENYTRAIRVSDGSANRVDRFRCLGNAVPPQLSYEIGHAIMAAHYGEINAQTR